MLDQGVLFVDVRSPIAFEHGHIPGAVNIDVRNSNFVAEFTKSIRKDQEFVIYCRGRHCDRSPEAIVVLAPLGYEKIFYFREGTPGWIKAGYALRTAAHEECPATGRNLAGSIECYCSTDAPAKHLWGSGPYWGGTNICLAARHSGIIGKYGGLVRVFPGPPQQSYRGSTANGLSSIDISGSLLPSFEVEAIGKAHTN